ncbi:MAG: 4-alpha-glucanotransferase [Deltaproteobacteria bacterium]|nr:4-alpha-glucanotransferase [Deltaproteobacteria bacterium]
MKRRRSGILLHLTSLPSAFGIGDMGPSAYRFVDFLAESGQTYWQILPLNPTDSLHGNSPYHSSSAFAFNPLLISPEALIQEGWLLQEDVETLEEFPPRKIDYKSVTAYRNRLFDRAFERFKSRNRVEEYDQFCSANAFWLDDFVLFSALKSHFHGQAWTEWPDELRDRHPDALQSMRKILRKEIEKEAFLQFLCFRQWGHLKDYCNGKQIQIIGDVPIYVVHDSAAVWVYPELFELDGGKRALKVAGVPPDYFSETGQLWGPPVYRWDILRKEGYHWWVQRIGHNLKLFDFLRIDHFRGFVGYWQVHASEKNAINGEWVKGPGEDFFDVILSHFPDAPIIAEDLGLITPDVHEVMNRFGFPGMKVLLFAFGQDLPTNPYAPHNHIENCVVYTGTHDNNTAKGWFEEEASPEERRRLLSYIGREFTGEEIHWELIRLAMMSVARTVIIPMQDVLGLDGNARMNRPGKKAGNWQWRLLEKELTSSLAERLSEMTHIYGRV